MPTDEPIKVEGEPSKAYALYSLGLNDEPIHTRIAEADTLEELNAKHKRRGDWKYAVYHHRKRIS
jgi:hypothetical protein